MREVFTPSQAAEYLQISTETVYRLIRSKQLAAVQIGRTYRIPREDLETFLLSHSNRKLVREGLFRRLLEAAERNPGVNSDDVLEELEREDAERRAQARARA
jgi:excisionase family DNA binding protein